MDAFLRGAKKAFGASAAPRVAVLGGGVSGCSAAHHLAALGCDVSLFEMGRGPGGRAGTRRSRSLPGLAVNHGAPTFDVRTDEGTAIMERLEAAGHAAEYVGVRGVLSAERGFSKSAASAVNWAGAGGSGMAGVSEGLLEEARKAGTPGSLACHYGAMVHALVPTMAAGGGGGGGGEVAGWSLVGADGSTLGATEDGAAPPPAPFDWLVVSGSGAAHPRWSEAFAGREAPLLAAASALRSEHGFEDEALTAALACIGAQEAAPCLVAMCAAAAGSETAAHWNAALPFDVAWVTEHPVVQKVSVQRDSSHPSGGDVSLVVHSTADYARSAPKDAYGVTSTAARLGGAPASAEREAALTAELLGALEELLHRHAGRFGLGELSCAAPYAEPLAWGPHLHRWGNCEPKGEPLYAGDAVAPRARVAFCGDYVLQEQGQKTNGKGKYVARMGSVEAALLSGATVAQAVAN